MSRADLDVIQEELKSAIKCHQNIFGKMKIEPRNKDLKKQLHDLQKKITSLSEKQKSVVQNLRKEIVTRQPSGNHTTSSNKPLVQPKVTASNMTSVVSTPVPIQPKPAASSMPVQITMMIKSMPPLMGSSTCPIPVSIVPQEDRPTLFPLSTSLSMPLASPVISPSEASVAPAMGRSSPPIRVPQYPMLRSASQSKPTTALKAPIPSSTISQKHCSENETKLKNIEEPKSLSKEEREKLNYMAALDLVTQDALKELQSRKHERKRRTTANPLYNFEPERRRPNSLMLGNSRRPRGRPPKTGKSASTPGTPDSTESIAAFRNGMYRNGTSDDIHEDYCAICGSTGQLLLCDTCSKVYHLQCLDPPLSCVPDGKWSCPKCQINGKCNNPVWTSETLAMVHSFIASKSAKEEEKRKLQKRTLEINTEIEHLENKKKKINDSFLQQKQRREELLEQQRLSQKSVEKLKNFIKVLQTS